MIKLNRHEYQEFLPVAKKYRSLLKTVLGQVGVPLNYYKLFTERRAGGARCKYFSIDSNQFDDVKKWVELFVHTHPVIHANGIKFEVNYEFIGRSVALHFRAVSTYTK